MKIESLARDAFLITSEKGIRILTDPYDPSIGHNEMDVQADVVTVSHDHKDHNHVAGVKGSPQVVKGSGQHEAKGIRFEGLSMFHDKTEGGERGPNTVFVFEVDGIRICHLGDLGHLPGETQIAELGRVDLLFCPVCGTVALNAAEANELVGKLKPRIVIPMHYATEKSGQRFAKVDEFLSGKENVVRSGSSSYDVTRKTLPSETQIVVLEHSR